ncbi:ABC transporter ATP-binding protein [Spirabiliibacterium falconis]|uniref:ABC transporter ATP-binding protein n=1 Tax=Spirabiliibacterium falconis TaxID=572023 RepID=UPI001AAC4EC6|nr:ABC transporter ATP-binding protein [Spirabiliibacterium falconis]MBE2894477.1 ABC transporter ATP-binding protein [Spirabiliibacterium falconis]
MTDLLRIDNLAVHYQNKAILSQLSLTLADSEILCLLGASGCGKTTLLKAIAGLLPVTSGSISLKGENITHQDSALRGIGLIFQDYALFPHLNVAQNIAFGLGQVSASERHAIIDEMLTLIGLSDYRHKFPHQLSGGQQQRVAIARSLACRPTLLLLDEPFSNIDTQVRLQLIDEIKSILKSQATPAIFVTHSKEEAFLFADKLALMAQGKIVQTGAPTALYHAPQNRFVADFLGQSNYVHATVIDAHTLGTELGNFSFATPLMFADQSAVRQGERVVCLIRPQQLQLHSSEPTNGHIINVRFLGHTFAYKVRLDTQTLVDVYSQKMLAEGERIKVTAKIDTAILFPDF